MGLQLVAVDQEEPELEKDSGCVPEEFGVSSDQIVNMAFKEQMQYVEAYLRNRLRESRYSSATREEVSPKDVTGVYILIFAPAKYADYHRNGASTPLYTAPQPGYYGNHPLDTNPKYGNNDGVITARELEKFVIFQAGQYARKK